MNTFKQRRDALLSKIGPEGAVVIAAAPECYRNRDSEYLYRQDSDFYYFTGFNEPESVMVLLPDQYILFCRPRNPDEEVWVGVRAGLEGAKETYGADRSYDISDFSKEIKKLLCAKKIYCPINDNSIYDELKVRYELNDLYPISSELRVIKSDYEIKRLKRAVEISSAAHSRAMRFVQPDMMEYELEAEIAHEFLRKGSRAPAYTTIVGGGANACVLHYVDNNKPLKSGDLVLVDAGAEYDYYASDITRTYPVNGKFSEQQKTIYNLVLSAQLAIIKKIKPGMLYGEMQKTAVQYITQGLVNLGILKGDVNQLIEGQQYKQFYMHGAGHWLGMDVHDVGSYRIDDEPRPLEPGMVFTVEPGIYIAAVDNVDKKWWNIGVRIEDDILVTENGCEVLSDAVPKTVADIEALMAQKT